jgi:uncharacterized protein YndB with AHSA1/START domain
MGRYQRTFTVGVPVERAWAAFADSHERSQWEACEYDIDPRPGGCVHWTLPGIESNGRVEEVVPLQLLRHRELDGPHTKSEITVTFEQVDDGTRITITHAGFGPTEDWDEWLEGTSLGWNQAIADLYVYLETGVTARRFASEMHSPGMTMHQTDAGLRVRSVEPDNLAAQAGLEVGDLVLTVGGVPIFTIPELWVLMREHGAGAKFAIEYVRDGERRRGTGVVHGGWPAESTASV